MFTKLFYRAILQHIIVEKFPEEYKRLIKMNNRSNPLEVPLGKIPFIFGKTTFYDYVRNYYEIKHPDVDIPSKS
jgi:hypothetical protein